ncbi:hypothetical protein MTR67_050830 [Solanum verrucosum]|uniref:CCHC-type domain-containing protein n=1 Tax=Solanum verrucosum TaxID=315347 RepID=A0AAF0V2R4_SOLVR|nr:hypothetical protein MTR67_050830 [Solanum verrucosum]
MVDDMRIRMSLFVIGLTRLSSKESKTTMLIGYMGIARLVIHVQQVEKDQMKDKEEFENRRAKTSESGSKRVMRTGLLSNISRKDLLYHLLVHLHQGTNVSTIVRILKISEQDLQSRKCGQNGHFMRECPKKKQGNGNWGNRAQFSSVALPGRVTSRGTTSGADI